MISDEELKRLEELARRATPGPWAVWDGPRFVGGGADLCIASGDGGKDWLANMDHRFNHYRGTHNRDDHDVDPDTTCDICAFDDEITAEQRATADYIAAANPAVLLSILTELRTRREAEKGK